MPIVGRLGLLMGVMALGSVQPSVVRADTIDGQWCSKDGRSFSIDGPKFVTPGEKRLDGDYDRHGFAYTVPAGEAGAGARVDMDLIDDYTLNVRTTDGAVKIWQRCRRLSS